jgi:FkbM family methyltransferase
MSEEKQTIEEIFNSEIERWVSDSGDVYRRLNYPEMDSNSLVMDLGGYIGNFTESIYSRYNCKVMVFEPVNRYYNICNYKFENNDKIEVYKYGLSGVDQKCTISVTGDISSTFVNIESDCEKEIITIKSIGDFFKENSIEKVDLIKINIEGGEYDLLDYLISNPEILKKIKNIQVQYHIFIDDHEKRRSLINSELEKTHERTWNYEWVWENWKIKNS